MNYTQLPAFRETVHLRWQSLWGDNHSNCIQLESGLPHVAHYLFASSSGCTLWIDFWIFSHFSSLFFGCSGSSFCLAQLSSSRRFSRTLSPYSGHCLTSRAYVKVRLAKWFLALTNWRGSKNNRCFPNRMTVMEAFPDCELWASWFQWKVAIRMFWIFLDVWQQPDLLKRNNCS